MNEQPATYTPIIRPIQIDGKEKPDQEDYIQTFRSLPDFVLKVNGILPADLDEGSLGVLLRSHRDAFRAIKQWIDCFKSNIADPLELHFNWKYDYKPYAEKSWAVHELAREVLERDLWGWKKEIESLSATEIWFSHEFERLEKAFQCQGFLGNAVRRGKHETCDAYLKQINQNFQTLHQRKFVDRSNFNNVQVREWDSMVESLRLHAEAIAQQDDDFRRHVYPRFLDIEKRAVRTIRNNPVFQRSGLNPDGSLDLGGKGKRGKGKKSSKSNQGFCKEK